MKVKQTILSVLSLGAISIGVLFYTSSVSYALPILPNNPGPTTPPTPEEKKKADEAKQDKSKEDKDKEEKDVPLKCSVLPQKICEASSEGDLEKSGTWLLLLFILQVLTIGIGIVAVGAIGYAGFLYATASDNEGQVKQAKEMIRNTAIGIVMYGLMYILLQFLIPGGVFT